ncbi:hypothetical protein FBU30_001496 [Linnemannia zychae]|nr:hypothetical protein FBU30_001496 [Linnemannia zychae]
MSQLPTKSVSFGPESNKHDISKAPVPCKSKRKLHDSDALNDDLDLSNKRRSTRNKKAEKSARVGSKSQDDVQIEGSDSIDLIALPVVSMKDVMLVAYEARLHELQAEKNHLRSPGLFKGHDVEGLLKR